MKKVIEHILPKKLPGRYNHNYEDQIQKLSFQLLENQKEKKEVFETYIREFGKISLMDLILYIILKKYKTKEDNLIIVHYLRSLDNFLSYLDVDASPAFIEEMLIRIAKFLTVQEFLSSTVFCRIGERGFHFYIILKGSVSILMPTIIKCQLTVNEYLAHLCLLNQLNEFELMRLTVESNKETYNVDIKDPSKPKIINLSNKVIKYQKRRNLDYSTADDYINFITPKRTKEKSNYYPEVNIYIYSIIIVLEEGSTFGEGALNSKKNLSTSTVFINEETVFGVLDELEFKMSIRAIQIQSKNEKIHFILNYNLFGSLSFDLFHKKFWNYFIQLKKNQGDMLFNQNEERKYIYFIRNGELDLSCRLSFTEINLLLEKFGQRLSPKGRNNLEDIQRNMKIATIKKNTLLGVDDLLTRNKRFFCSAVCVSQTADLFAIEVNILETIIDFCLSRKDFNEIIAEKNKIMVDRLNSFKLVSSIVYQRSSEQTQMSKSEKSIVDTLQTHSMKLKKKPKSNFKNQNTSLETHKFRLKSSSKLVITSNLKNELPLMSETNISYLKTQSCEILKHNLSKIKFKVAKKRIFSSFSPNQYHKRMSFVQTLNGFKDKKHKYKSVLTSFNRKSLSSSEKKKTNETPEERKLLRLCKNSNQANPYKTLIFSKIELNSDYSIKKSFDFNTFVSCCLMNNNE